MLPVSRFTPTSPSKRAKSLCLRFRRGRRIRKIVLHPSGHRAPKKARYLLNSRLFLFHLGWLMGLEPQAKKSLKIKDLQNATVFCVVKCVTPIRDTRKTAFLKTTW